MNSESQIPLTWLATSAAACLFLKTLLLEHSCGLHLGLFPAVWAAEAWGTWLTLQRLSEPFTCGSRLMLRTAVPAAGGKAEAQGGQDTCLPTQVRGGAGLQHPGRQGRVLRALPPRQAH